MKDNSSDTYFCLSNFRGSPARKSSILRYHEKMKSNLTPPPLECKYTLEDFNTLLKEADTLISIISRYVTRNLDRL